MELKWKDNRTVLADSLYLFLLQGMNQLLPLIILPYLIVVLGAKSYGNIGFALSFVQSLILVVDFGFNFSATKRIAQCRDDKDRMNRIFWSVVWAKSLLLLACSLLMLLLIWAVPTFGLYGKAILCTYPMVVGSTFTFMWMFQGIGKVKHMAVINTLSKFLLLPLVFVFVKTPDDFMLAAVLQSMVYVLTAVVSNIYLWRMGVVRKPSLSWANTKEELRDSLPLFVSSASSNIYTQLFVVILGFYCTEEAVGRYAAAERVMRCLCFGLFTPLNQAFFPRISTLSTQGVSAAMPALNLVKTLAFYCMAAVAAFMLFGASLIQDFLGEEYQGIAFILRLMSPAPLFIGIGGVLGLMGLIAMGNQVSKKHFRNVYMIVAVAALVMVLALTSWCEERGTALAMVLTEAAVCLLMAYYYKKDIRIPYKSVLEHGK